MPVITLILILVVIGSGAYVLYLRAKGNPHGNSHSEGHHGGNEGGHTDHEEVGGHQMAEAQHHVESVVHTPAIPTLPTSVKVVVYVPDAHANALRQAIGEAGAGSIGNYNFCSFSSLGTGRYLPGQGANPMVGTIGVHERVEEERIEFTCDRHILSKVVSTIKKAHPYEEIIIDIYPLEPHPAGEPVHSH